MEPLLKRQFLKFRRSISVKMHHRTITTLLLILLGLISAFGIQVLSVERAIGTTPEELPLICSRTPTLSAEQLSVQGRASYEKGRFDEAIDCWQRAVTAYNQPGKETEKIHSQINLAQAEQALGLYPRACKTLLPIYGFPEQKCSELLQGENSGDQFFKQLEKETNSPAKIAGLRRLGNILRELGTLDLSAKVLSLNLNMAQPQDRAAILLDLGNTKRALSNKELDLYNRSQEQPNLICAIADAYAANNDYRKAVDEMVTTSDSTSLIKLQAQLNQLSLLLDLKNSFNEFENEFNEEAKPVFKKLMIQQDSFILSDKKKQSCSSYHALDSDQSQEIHNWFAQQFSINNQDQSVQLQPRNTLIQQIAELQQRIEQLPLNRAAIFTRLNLAQILLKAKFFSVINTKIKSFLNTTVAQTTNKCVPSQGQCDLRAKSYALGYLGKYSYQEEKDWKLARTRTEQALFLAQSISALDIAYQWHWQLGKIHKTQGNLAEAILAYKGAYNTLESLRRELATSNPDTQLAFQKDIDSIYREYVDLLLREDKPSQEKLREARQVIASLQAVELENFLRQACPEYNLEKIDEVIDTNKRAQKAAFFYPIVIRNEEQNKVRVEVIIKLPNQSQISQKKGLKYYIKLLDRRKNLSERELKHYRTTEPIERQEFDKIIRELQIALEEEYTFDEIRIKSHQMYQWLFAGAEQYLKSEDIDTLVFALDTTLRNIPLAALVYDLEQNQQGKNRYLIEKYAIALSPRLEIQSPQPLTSKTLKILAAGLSKADQNFPELRYVKTELEALKELKNTGNTEVSVTQLLNDEFTIDKFKKEFNTSAFKIVHLATHGEFSSSPEKTFILASSQQNKVQPLKINELDKLFRDRNQVQAETIELLVLSACETATGDRRATLGISGVAVRAGAGSAVASLWTLDDEVSVKFTQEFYKQLINSNLTKAQALQKAQLELMNSEKYERQYEHPRYWAPYILVGNWL